MKRLQVEIDGSFEYVFCHIGRKIVKASCKEKALHGNHALQYFSEMFPDYRFKLES